MLVVGVNEGQRVLSHEIRSAAVRVIRSGCEHGTAEYIRIYLPGNTLAQRLQGLSASILSAHGAELASLLSSAYLTAVLGGLYCPCAQTSFVYDVVGLLERQ